MSTFLIGLVVVAATVVVVLVALSDPDQPATIRRPTDRDRPRRRHRPPPAPQPDARLDPALAPDAPLTADAPLTVPLRPRAPTDRRPARPGTQRKRRSQPRREPAQAWVRLRSGLALLVLVTFVGVVMALTMGTGLALFARALRHAVG
ncbi:MAG: hypothetical protein M3011_05150 [Actinomycetota bacterium]|nr:hypothetical protein [Actinomycetota bacterium]